MTSTRMRRPRFNMGDDKTCTGCNTFKPLDEFASRRESKDGKQTRCRACVSAYDAVRYKNMAPPRVRVFIPEEERGAYKKAYDALRYNPKEGRAHHLKQKYGLSVEDYERMLIAQSGRCDACNAPMIGSREPCVDHNHKTGRVRALLCSPCNRTIGHAKEDPICLRVLAVYLEVHHG
jgi:hypothetical protein